MSAIDFSSKFFIEHSAMISRCYEMIMNESLSERLGIVGNATGEQYAEALFKAPAAILSHDIQNGETGRDNIYNYANRVALELFERTFEEQICLASTKSADASDAPQSDRNNLLAQCLAKGHVSFSTTRLSASGRVVELRDAILFNLFDRIGIYRGQAVVFDPVN